MTRSRCRKHLAAARSTGGDIAPAPVPSAAVKEEDQDCALARDQLRPAAPIESFRARKHLAAARSTGGDIAPAPVPSAAVKEEDQDCALARDQLRPAAPIESF